jgi:hypothetical protein
MGLWQTPMSRIHNACRRRVTVDKTAIYHEARWVAFVGAKRIDDENILEEQSLAWWLWQAEDGPSITGSGWKNKDVSEKKSAVCMKTRTTCNIDDAYIWKTRSRFRRAGRWLCCIVHVDTDNLRRKQSENRRALNAAALQPYFCVRESHNIVREHDVSYFTSPASTRFHIKSVSDVKKWGAKHDNMKAHALRWRK